MRLPGNFFGVWGLVALGVFLVSAILIGSVAVVSGAGWGLVNQRLESGGALRSLLAFLIVTGMISWAVHWRNQQHKG